MSVRAQRVGIIRIKGKRLIIIMKDETIYFVSISALRAVLDGERDMTPLWGYP